MRLTQSAMYTRTSAVARDRNVIRYSSVCAFLTHCSRGIDVVMESDERCVHRHEVPLRWTFPEPETRIELLTCSLRGLHLRMLTNVHGQKPRSQRCADTGERPRTNWDAR